MSQIKTLNGVQYTLPQYSDTGWGANTGNVLTQYLAAIADVTLQLSGGAFTLTAETDFGSNFGLKALYIKTETANPASAGILRLAKTDAVKWRNNANGADLTLSIDGSDNLQFQSTKILLSGAVVNADINAAAAIAYSKLNLTGSIVNADIGASAAIAYSKLNLSGSIVNADIGAAAAIAVSKLAALTASSVVKTDGSGFLTTGSVDLASQVTGNLDKAHLNSGTGASSSTFWRGDNTWASPTIALTKMTVQKFTSGSGTYTTPTSPAPIYIRVKMVGGGGGGTGSGTAGAGNGGNGGDTTFGATAVAGHGSGGNWGSVTGGAGGTNVTDGTVIANIAGGAGQGGQEPNATALILHGGSGASTYFGSGGGGAGNGAGAAAPTNSGGGGGGASIGGVTTGASGSGGGSGGYMELLYTSPSATYAYAVGGAGSAGGAGTSGSAGGAGGSGYIVVEEYYQ